MNARRIVGLVLVVIALPFLFLGLIDPLEGGIALILGIVLGLAAWLVSRVPPPRFTWISLAVTVALGVATLLLALLARDTGPMDATGTMDNTASNPFATVPIAIIGLWAYRLSVLVTVTGGVWYVVRLARAITKSRVILACLVTACLIVPVAIGGALVFIVSRSFSQPEFESLAQNPQSSLHGTIAYYSDQTGCIRLVEASGRFIKDAYCPPDEALETRIAKGKPIGPHLAWLDDGRLQVTMYRMTEGGPEVTAGWQRIIDVNTGAVESVPDDQVPSTAPSISHATTSPTGATVTTTSEDGHATVSLTENGVTRTLLDVTGDAETYRMAPAYWSPNYEWIAADDGRILIVTLADPSTTWILAEDAGMTADERFDRFAIKP